MIVVPGCSAAAIRAFSVTVSPRSVSTIGRVGSIDPVDGGVVVALGRLDLEAERAQRRHVRLDGAGAEVAAAGVRAARRCRRGGAAGRGTSAPSGYAGPRPRRSRSGRGRVGGMISRSPSSPIQRVWTPRLPSTSSRRLTSSIRATLRSVVRPRLSSEAHSRATPAFLEVLTSISPESVVGPVIRRWVGPAPSATISESRAEPIRATISRERFWWPFSIRLTALWLVLSRSASCCWVSPRCVRASRIRFPMRPLKSSVMGSRYLICEISLQPLVSRSGGGRRCGHDVTPEVAR